MVAMRQLKGKTEANHKLYIALLNMTYYSCFDQKGQIIARCQTFQDIEVLKKMGRPIAVSYTHLTLPTICSV